MLESLKHIGEALQGEDLPIASPPKGKYLIQVIFDLDSKEITYDILSSDKREQRSICG